MNRFLFFSLLLLINKTALLAQHPLKNGFENPPSTAKPQTFWTWINSNVSKEGITADLEAMNRVGIHEAMIYNVDMGLPEGPVKYLSPQWLEMFRFAATEAKRLGMQIGFHNGAGWSSSGGPWVKPEDAMQKIVYSIVSIKNGEKFQQPIPTPKSEIGYYEDIAVLAFPTLKSDQRIDNLSKKSLSGNFFTNNLEPDIKTIPDAGIIKKDRIIDLTARLSFNGMLDWQPPAGNWTIIRIGHTPNGAENHPAVASGKGLECDKMSTEALDKYWEGGIKPILKSVGPLAGSILTDCFIDSYEVGCNNWTKLFRREFKKRRGYDCLTYLPTIAGFYVESGEVSERFLWDFRQTVSDLITDNYYGHFRKLCQDNGMKLVVEPYGGPFKSHSAGSKANGVMGEFWLEKKLFLESPKLAASIAHINGQSIVGSESFTSFSNWANYPATMKPVGDRVWTEGINRFVFHVYAHQPWSIPPGLTYGDYGVEMNRMNTWWEQSKPYMSYLSRSQYLLQQGQSVADVLTFTGESRVNNATVHNDIKRRGYDYDQIGTDQMSKLTVVDGKIFTEHSGPYHLLILPESDWATPELLEKIKSLVYAGAIVLGRKPKKSPSLDNYPQCDTQVTALANELWPNKINDISTLDDVCSLLNQRNLAPDFSTEISGNDLNFIHRSYGKDDIYLVANPLVQSRIEICRFRVSEKKPELWDAETGMISDLPVWKELPGGLTEIPISFSSNGTALIVFRNVTAVPKHIVSIKETLSPEASKPLPHLQIIKAEYGVFLPDGIIDVTASLTDRIKRKGLIISTDIASLDPAPGSMKELRLEYEAHGERRQLLLLEGEHRNITEDSVGFHLIRALYGKFREDFKDIFPACVIRNVTTEVNELVNSGKTLFIVSDSLFKVSTFEKGDKNELRVTYKAYGENKDMVVVNGHMAVFEQDLPQSRIVEKNKKLLWLTPRSGKLIYADNSGNKKIAIVNYVSKPLTFIGPWDVTFPLADRSLKKVIFRKLNSWTTFADDDIHYFSGTAVYKKSVQISAELIGSNKYVELDLSNVKVIAEVIVNGKNLGVLWKAPFRLNLQKVLHTGINKFEIRVTNLWPNRLIGDERFADDGIQKLNGQNKWPEWLLNNKKHRDSKRVTFTNHKYFKTSSDLEISGLLGPVTLYFFNQADIGHL